MGISYGATLNFYEDGTFTNVVVSMDFNFNCVEYSTLYPTTDAGDNYNFLLSYLRRGTEASFLNCVYRHVDIFRGHTTDLFYPGSVSWQVPRGNEYPEIVFSNGAKLRAPIGLNGASSHGWYAYDEDGNLIQRYEDRPFGGLHPPNIIGSGTNGFYSGCVLACSSIDSDGKISDVYAFNLTADGPPWRQVFICPEVDTEFVHFLNNYVQGSYIPTEGDPYENIGYSGVAGGGGSGDPGGDIIPEPSLPTVSAISSGMAKLYNPTSSQLISFARWLWDSDGLDLETLKRVFNDPMDMILGLSILPVTPDTIGDEYITLGNITSTVSANRVLTQFVKINMGTVVLGEVYNSYLDYSPYTKVQIFLPYIGCQELDADEVMGSRITLSYSVDLLSGACVAHILVNGSLMYEFSGSCSTQIPLTGRDHTAVVQGVVGTITSGIMAAAAAAGAAATLPASLAGTLGGGAVIASASASGLAGMAREITSSKPTIKHSSTVAGNSGYLSSQIPFLIVTRPRLCHPAHQEHFTGYPGFIFSTIGNLSGGFVKFVNIEIINVHATDSELDEIIDWLMNKGVRV